MILSEDAIRKYYESRAQMNGISVLQLEESVQTPLPGVKKFSLSSVGEGIGRAVGFLRRKVEKDGESTRVAKSKRRGRLLDGLETGDTQIGAMDDVDALLREQK